MHASRSPAFRTRWRVWGMIAGIVPGQRPSTCSTSRKPLAARPTLELAVELALFVLCLVTWQGVHVIDIDDRRSHEAGTRCSPQYRRTRTGPQQSELGHHCSMNDLDQLWLVHTH
jgi:hypothetical protein